MARTVEYPVILTEKERNYLRKNTSAGKWGVRAVKRAQIILKADTSENSVVEEEQIASEVGCSLSTEGIAKLSPKS